MLELILKLYTTAMAGDVRSPCPHIFGPPGCGKSTFVEQAAELLGVNLHIINVSRISPLELEGVQMPDKNHTEINLLTAIYWKRLKEGDIILFDEFLRGFPEVYNGLLDIMTSRQVGGFKLPKVFMIAASNSTVAYDKALEDRLLHLPVPDPRKLKSEKSKIAQVIVDKIGLLPDMVKSNEMTDLIHYEVNPTYDILDALTKKGNIGAASVKGSSVRNLIGQAQLRHSTSEYLTELLAENNRLAINKGKHQFVVLLDGKGVDPRYEATAPKLEGNPKLSALQATNLQINLQLMRLEKARVAAATSADDDGLEDILYEGN